jgi:hypothetical protein
MSTPHRATPELWDRLQQLIDEGLGDLTDSLVLELCSRVKALERRCEVQLRHLSDLAGLHHRLAGSVRLLERDVVVDQPEPAPLATDQDLYQLYDLTGPTVADAFRAIYDLGRQHGADQVAPVQSLMERVEALASGDAPVFDPLTNVTGKGVTVEGSFDQDGTTYVFKTAAQPAPATEESSAPAPAGSLVERVMVLLGHHGDGTARAAIREVAAWLRAREGRHTHSSVVIAGDLELEALPNG